MFCLWFLSWVSFPPAPEDRFKYFRKFAENLKRP
jgi:hypothetical protein